MAPLMGFQQGSALLGWEQLAEDRRRALAQIPPKNSNASVRSESLPSYNDAAKGSEHTVIDEKREHGQQTQSTMSKIKTAFNKYNDIQRHHPMYVLEDSVSQDGRYSQDRSRNASVSTSSSNSSSSSTRSSLKGIFTGSYHKHHPMYKLEESAVESQHRNRSS